MILVSACACKVDVGDIHERCDITPTRDEADLSFCCVRPINSSGTLLRLDARVGYGESSGPARMPPVLKKALVLGSLLRLELLLRFSCRSENGVSCRPPLPA